jgi:hypothetical protein
MGTRPPTKEAQAVREVRFSDLDCRGTKYRRTERRDCSLDTVSQTFTAGTPAVPCGSSPSNIFGTRNPLPNYPARFNIAPTDPVLTVRFNPETKERWVLRGKPRVVGRHDEGHGVATVTVAKRQQQSAHLVVPPAVGDADWRE